MTSDALRTPHSDQGELHSTAVIVVNYGSHDLLAANLAAVSDACGEAAYFVVDNFTSSSERQAIAELCTAREWTPVLLSRNTGFGEGVNAGVSAALASGRSTLLILNPDATIDRESMLRLVTAVSNDPALMVAPVIHWSDGRTWFSGSDLYLADGRMGNPRRRNERPGEEFREWLSGACFAISKELWLAAGGFDSDYFLYWEDVDLSFRVVEAGGKLAIDPHARAVHDEGGTHTERPRGRAKSEIFYYYNIRNRLVYAAKHLNEQQRDGWLRATWRVSYEILLQGGRAQFARPWVPGRALFRGIRDGRRFIAQSHPGGR